jgi:hypothetical protein
LKLNLLVDYFLEKSVDKPKNSNQFQNTYPESDSTPEDKEISIHFYKLLVIKKLMNKYVRMFKKMNVGKRDENKTSDLLNHSSPSKHTRIIDTQLLIKKHKAGNFGVILDLIKIAIKRQKQKKTVKIIKNYARVDKVWLEGY